MTETGALSPADVMAMTNSEGLGGNNAFFWIFALLLLGAGVDIVTGQIQATINNYRKL